MRNTKIILVALALVTGSVGPVLAKDWSAMGLAERLAWAEQYEGQACPYGMDVSKADLARKDEIAGAPQFGVKLWVYSHCKSGKTRNASR